jgi:hypothetical protein
MLFRKLGLRSGCLVKAAFRIRAKYLYSFGAHAARVPGSMDRTKSAVLNLEIGKRFIGEHVLD